MQCKAGATIQARPGHPHVEGGGSRDRRARWLPGTPSFCRSWLFVIAAALGSSVLAQVALEGPFLPGTGSWTPVTGGGFEGTAGPLVSRVTYVLDGKWFLMTSVGSAGSASVDAVAAHRLQRDLGGEVGGEAGV